MTDERQRGRDAHLDVSLPADELAPLVARRAVSLVATSEAGELGDALLLTSELVSNAVLHAGADAARRVDLRVVHEHGCLRVEVTNRRRRATVGAFDERVGWDLEHTQRATGWGLRLVDLIAQRWGTVHTPTTTTVWFEIQTGALKGGRGAADERQPSRPFHPAA